MFLSSLVPLAMLLPAVFAHPEPSEPLTEAEILRRTIATRERHQLARRCAPQIAEFTFQRREKRALARRGIEKRQIDCNSATSTSSAIVPHYTEIQNFTCVTAPEVIEGPYYINNEMVRYDLREDQVGVQLVLDVGVLDINTCEPVPNAFVEIWSTNATGIYGGYPATLAVLPIDNSTTTTTDSSATTTTTDTTTTSTALPPGVGDQSLVRNETFARGGLPTNENGVVELVTLYPGYYEGRTAHVHTMIHLNWTESDNGTLVSHSGSLLHVGQFFFNESWNDQVYATDPYTTNANNRTYNDEDTILATQNSNGNNAFLDIELLGADLSEGLLGYITVGVNSSASYTITNTNYLNSSTTTDNTTTATSSFLARAMEFAAAR